MNIKQIEASDPIISSWVSASAGTGKTKILTDRVLRLLLSGAEFKRILCLTFTNAAAGEMKERIISALADWENSNLSELKSKLFKTIGHEPSKAEIFLAKTLYKRILTADQGINIQTIHSFCQKLLKKFPLESGIAPSFSIMDESKSLIILKQIKNDLLNREEIAPISEYLNANFHEVIINEIISEIVHNKQKFMALDDIYDHYDKEQLQKLISSVNSLYSEQWLSIASLPIVQTLTNIDLHQDYAKEQDIRACIKQLFLTSSGQKRKKIVPVKIAKKGSNLYDDLETIQEQVFLLDQAEKNQQIKCHSQIITILGKLILAKYEEYKSSRALLDYDDLIIYSKRLLKSSHAREWVLYKIDGGIDHLLVDEAQDTSPDQWEIIDSLITEFYSGDSKQEDKNRTIFVVGDEKQSIFSFQGADVSSFSRMNFALKQKMQSGRKLFKNIELGISYRSAQEIIKAVDLVFDSIYRKTPAIFSQKISSIEAHRQDHSGCVEIWPLCVNNEKEEAFWPHTHSENTSDAKIILAEKISGFIKSELASNRVLPATGKAISPDDFMVLFRKRDDLTNEVIKALKKYDIAVTGLDRISLCDNLAILDLISIAKFVLNPEDDLNLASLIKSPIFGFSEQNLYNLARERIRERISIESANKKPKLQSIWHEISSKQHIKEYAKLYQTLNSFINLYRITHIGNFFKYIVDIMGYRSLLNSSCGPDSNEVIDELLYICDSFHQQNSSSLQEFIFWLGEHETSIKRDISPQGKVRIMTTHASKGLQAPIVILCDTTGVPSQSDRFYWNQNSEMLSPINSSSISEDFKALKQAQQDKTYAEYLRLLYVGMTRAEDHLVVCGYQGARTISENCWYELIKSALFEYAKPSADGSLMIGERPVIEHETASQKLCEQSEILPIDYKSGFISKYTDNILYESASYKYPSPLVQKDSANYGLVFHKILEDSLIVPDLNIMKTHPLIRTLDDVLQKRLFRSIDKIIENQDFLKLIQKKFYTEVNIGSKEADGHKVGRIDLMIFDEKDIIILDYKSDSIVPKNVEQVPPGYQKQLASYVKIIGEIYPKHNIKTMILWLENGQLMNCTQIAS